MQNHPKKSRILNIPDQEIFWFRPYFLNYTSIGIGLMGLIYLILGYFIPSNWNYFTLFVVLFSFYSFFLIRTKKVFFSALTLLIGLNFAIAYQMIMEKTAYVATLFVIIIFIAGFLVEFKWILFLYLIDLSIIIVLLIIGDFTWGITRDPTTMISLVNNVTVLIPIISIGTVLAYITSKILLGTIKSQKIQNDLLENEIISRKEIEAKLHNTLKELERLSNTKTLLMANLSHELRTPLNAIIGFTDVFLDNPELINLNERMDIIKSINENGNHLCRMLEQVLNITNLDSGKIEVNKSQFALNTLVSSILTKYQYQISTKQIQVDVILEQPLSEIVSDRKILSKILENLFENAIKFNVLKGKIILSYRTTSNEIIFEIKDTGIGIEKKDFPLLFQPFKQLDDSIIKKVPGLGLGLYYTKRLIELINGKIWFESELGVGSIFSFSIPF